MRLGKDQIRLGNTCSNELGMRLSQKSLEWSMAKEAGMRLLTTREPGMKGYI